MRFEKYFDSVQAAKAYIESLECGELKITQNGETLTGALRTTGIRP